MTSPIRIGAIGTLAAVLVAAPAGVGYSAYRQDLGARGLLPAGANVGGIDVSGLSRDEAIAAVRNVVERALDKPAVLKVGDREFRVSQRRLGATMEVEQAVDRAFDEVAGGSWASRWWDRVTKDTPAPPRVSVTHVLPADHAVRAWVANVAKDVEQPATDGAIRVEGGFLRFDHAKPGQALDVEEAVESVNASLDDGQPHEASLDPVAPQRDDSRGVALLVRTGENKLYYYKDGKLQRTYGVATGSPRYPTPTGRFKVTLKRYRPTWVNPWSKWSMNEPASIPPGPNNPLGTRALNLDAPGIRIHGTPAPRSIGYSVSHGCIRMRMAEVEELYDLVPTGTPVFIVRGGPARTPGSAASTPADIADGG